MRMAMRIMLRMGLRVSECLSLCPADLRFSPDPPIISLRPDVVLLGARFLGAGYLPSASCRASRSLSRTKSKLAVIPDWDFRRSFICSAVSPCRLQESNLAGSNFLEAGMMVISPNRF